MIFCLVFFFNHLVSLFLYFIKFKFIALGFGALQRPVLFSYLLLCLLVTINSKHEVFKEYLQGMLATKKVNYQRLLIGELFSLLAAGQELKIKTCFWIRRQRQPLSLSLSFFSICN